MSLDIVHCLKALTFFILGTCTHGHMYHCHFVITKARFWLSGLSYLVPDSLNFLESVPPPLSHPSCFSYLRIVGLRQQKLYSVHQEGCKDPDKGVCEKKGECSKQSLGTLWMNGWINESMNKWKLEGEEKNDEEADLLDPWHLWILGLRNG